MVNAPLQYGSASVKDWPKIFSSRNGSARLLVSDFSSVLWDDDTNWFPYPLVDCFEEVRCSSLYLRLSCRQLAYWVYAGAETPACGCPGASSDRLILLGADAGLSDPLADRFVVLLCDSGGAIDDAGRVTLRTGGYVYGV